MSGVGCFYITSIPQSFFQYQYFMFILRVINSGDRVNTYGYVLFLPNLHSELILWPISSILEL